MRYILSIWILAMCIGISPSQLYAQEKTGVYLTYEDFLNNKVTDYGICGVNNSLGKRSNIWCYKDSEVTKYKSKENPFWGYYGDNGFFRIIKEGIVWTVLEDGPVNMVVEDVRISYYTYGRYGEVESVMLMEGSEASILTNLNAEPISGLELVDKLEELFKPYPELYSSYTSIKQRWKRGLFRHTTKHIRQYNDIITAKMKKTEEIKKAE